MSFLKNDTPDRSKDSDLIRSSLMCVAQVGDFLLRFSEDLRQATTFCKGIAAKQMRA